MSYALSSGVRGVVQHRLFDDIMGGGSAARRLGGSAAIYTVWSVLAAQRLSWRYIQGRVL